MHSILLIAAVLPNILRGEKGSPECSNSPCWLGTMHMIHTKGTMMLLLFMSYFLYFPPLLQTPAPHTLASHPCGPRNHPPDLGEGKNGGGHDCYLDTLEGKMSWLLSFVLEAGLVLKQTCTFKDYFLVLQHCKEVCFTVAEQANQCLWNYQADWLPVRGGTWGRGKPVKCKHLKVDFHW